MKSLDPIRFGGIILALALALVLSGCSAVKLGYNTLPELAYWWLDGYADFEDVQRPQVRGELSRLHAWHRQGELPRLAGLLGRMEQMARGPIPPEQACGVLADVQASMNSLADQAEPAVIALATSLTPQQLRHIERKLRSSNDNFRKEWITPAPAERQDRRFARMLDRLEMIYGELDAPQEAVLRQGLAQSSYDPQRLLSERQRRQQDLLQTLQRVARPEANAAEARVELRGWLERTQRPPDPAYRAWQEGLLQEGCSIFSAVHQSTTDAQREKAARRLAAYQRDLRELAQSR
jgi:hypothetical protein